MSFDEKRIWDVVFLSRAKKLSFAVVVGWSSEVRDWKIARQEKIRETKQSKAKKRKGGEWRRQHYGDKYKTRIMHVCRCVCELEIRMIRANSPHSCCCYFIRIRISWCLLFVHVYLYLYLHLCGSAGPGVLCLWVGVVVVHMFALLLLPGVVWSVLIRFFGMDDIIWSLVCRCHRCCPIFHPSFGSLARHQLFFLR